LTFGTVVNHIRGTEMYTGVQPALMVEDGQRWGSGIYIQHEHKLTDDLKLIGGLQANKIGSLAPNVVPRGGVLWNPAAHFSLKALYGGAFRAPSLDESGLTHPGLRGNPNLVPEKVGTLDLQVSYRNNRVEASADYFHSRETELIFEDGSVRPALYYNLSAPATFQGIDSEGKYYVGRHWFLMESVLYQANHDEAIANLSAIPSLGAKAGVSYKAENGADVSVFDAYQGHLGGYAAAVNPRPEAFHSVSAHVRFDLTKRWLKSGAPGVALFVHGDDLANHQVWLPALGTNSANTIPVVRGRTVYFGVEVWRKE
jgi:outer membrane receptor protein involved in Fe transport